MSDIRCRNLCKTFTGAAKPLPPWTRSAWISGGAFVCLSGPSGSGKTTLLNALGGLDTPDSGTIAIGEQRLSICPGGSGQTCGCTISVSCSRPTT